MEDSSHQIRFQILSNDDDLYSPPDWNPIMNISILYKWFTHTLYNHISPDPFISQSYDHHTSTSDVHFEDALLIIENVIEYSLEFNTYIWMMNMVMCKTIDMIEYESLFNTLSIHGIIREYIILFHQLDTRQTDWVEGITFNIGWGIKQGDNLSSILLNTHWILYSSDGNRDSPWNNYWSIHHQNDWSILVMSMIFFFVSNV